MAQQNTDSFVAKLLDQARKAVDEYQLELAVKFYQKAAAAQPDNVDVLEAMAEVMTELGQREEAIEVLRRHVRLTSAEGRATSRTSYSVLMNLGQLQEGHEALATYKAGLELMHAERTQLAAAGSLEEAKALDARMASGLCSMAELFMTDLCDEANAETECEGLITRAILAQATSPEPHIQLASFRLCQQKMPEAKSAARKAAQLLTDHGDALKQANMKQAFAQRVAVGKLFLELSLFDEAIEWLKATLEEDEEQPEVWFVLALAHREKEEWEPAFECAERAKQLATHPETGAGVDEGLMEQILGLAQEAMEQVPASAFTDDEDDGMED